jgi:hypothetical protein
MADSPRKRAGAISGALQSGRSARWGQQDQRESAKSADASAQRFDYVEATEAEDLHQNPEPEAYAMDSQQLEKLEAEESMFVQTAQDAAGADGVLTLRGVTPSTLYFSDRPQRVVGHMTTADFVELWGEGDNSFEADPPNAVLSFLEAGDAAPEDAVVVLTAPHLEDGELSYSVDVLEGTLPTEAGPVTLFIDPFGRPLSPVSVCGVRRRERRRMRRRF